MSLAINVGYGLLGCIQQKYKYKTWKNTFKRLFWTDIFTVKSTKVFREEKVFQNVLLTAFGYIFCPYSGAKFKSARIFCPRQPCCIWQQSFNQVSKTLLLEVLVHRGDFPQRLRPRLQSRKYGVDCKTVYLSLASFWDLWNAQNLLLSLHFLFHCHTLSKLENWQKMLIYFFVAWPATSWLLHSWRPVMEKSIFVNDLRKKCCIRWRLFQDHLQNYNTEIQLAVSLMVSKVSKAWKLERKLRFRIWMSKVSSQQYYLSWKFEQKIIRFWKILLHSRSI